MVGSVGKGGSIAILLLIGFLLGAGASTLLFWWQKRRQMRIEVRRRFVRERGGWCSGGAGLALGTWGLVVASSLSPAALTAWLVL